MDLSGVPNGCFSCSVKPDADAFLRVLGRRGEPKRVHHVELAVDPEIRATIGRRYHLASGLNPNDPFFKQQLMIREQRFLGYDYVRVVPDGVRVAVHQTATQDTADLARSGGRRFTDEHRGPITNWEEFEKYPWPDPAQFSTRELDWYQKNLPDDTCLIGAGLSHFAEYLSWLMGYETLCYALFDQRDLVQAIVERVTELNRAAIRLLLSYDRVKVIWGSDDMGFRNGTLLSPTDLRALVLPGHKDAAQATHDAGRLYILHSCGNLAAIMDDLIADVRIDAKHSFEDNIERVEDAMDRYGSRIALLGGVDVDFLCRADEGRIRGRVREILTHRKLGVSYMLGSGNSIANYVPVDHYLAMLDEGRRFAG